MDSQLSKNDVQQMLRIASGATLGFAISKALDWPNPIFFTLYPILLLGLVAVLNGHTIRQFLAATIFPAAAVLVVYGLFGSHPLLITPLIANDVMFREPLNPSLDGNTVELAVEQMEFSENVVRYQTTLQFLTNKISGLMSAIKGE
mgnify:CR=1 FL=1